MAETLGLPPQPAAPKPTTKNKTVRLLLKYDLWIDDGNGGTVRLETNIKKIDDRGQPIFDRSKGDFVYEQVEHDVPIEVAKILLAEGKAVRTDPLPGEVA